MKSTPRRNLQAYSAFALSLLGAEALSGQTIIQNFEPDLRMLNWNGEYTGDDDIEIDLDGNGIIDLDLKYTESNWSARIEITLDDAALSVYTNGGSTHYAQALGSFDSVGPDLSDWSNGSVLLAFAERSFGSSSSFDCWTSVWYGWSFFQNKFLGFRFQMEDGIHYGWLRLQIKDLGPDECTPRTGSPLTVFEYGYEATPDQPVVCYSSELRGCDFSLTDESDTENFSEFRLNYSGFAPSKYSELRYYLIPHRDEALSFTLSDALTMPATGYFSMFSSDVIDHPTGSISLPSYVADIDGQPLNHDNKYAVYQLAIPNEGDASQQTLSAPAGPYISGDNSCLIHPTEIKIESLIPSDSGFNVRIQFNEGEFDNGITSYLVTLGDANYYYYYNYGTCDLPAENARVAEPHFGVPAPGVIVTHEVDLINVSTDMHGNPLYEGEEVVPIVIGVGDGNHYDLNCFWSGDYYYAWTLPISSIEVSNGIQLIMTGNILQVIIPAIMQNENYFVELNSLSGQKLFSKEISGSDNIIELPESLPAGFYIAALKNSEQYVAQLKVIMAE